MLVWERNSAQIQLRQSIMAEEKKTAAPEEKKEPVGEAEEVRVAHDALNTKYNPFTLSMCRLYLCLLIPYLCGCLNGYDGSLMGGLNGMDSYLAFFNMYDPPSMR